jgi:tRNA dimethylallyltransferase
MSQKTVIVITGPTASGKTSLSLQLAEHFNTAVISADSRQCYKELNIGVAKPPADDLERIQHYFINSHSIHQQVNAGVYESYALAAANTIFSKNDTAVLVGGTGLYIKAFCEGVDEIPEVDEQIRITLRNEYKERGLVWLQEMVQQNDALFFEKGEMQNPQRMLRALEVKFSSGQSILNLHSSPRKQRPFTIIKIGIAPPRQELYNNINKRVDSMIKDGLEEEVRLLEPYRAINALQTVGYRELLDCFDGLISREQAIENIKKNTRHYAKRQLTWFKKDEQIRWINNDSKNTITQILELLSIAGK